MNYSDFFKTLCYDIFIASFATYLASIGIESISRGFITSVVQLNGVLLICGVSGLVVLIFPPKAVTSNSALDYVFSITIAGLASVLTYQVLKTEGTIAPLLAITMGVLILVFTLSLRKISIKDDSDIQ